MVFPISQELAGPWVRPNTLGSLPEPAGNLLWVLTLSGQACSTAELAEITAQSRQMVRQSMARLAGQQLVFKVAKDQWLLAADFRDQVAAVTRQSIQSNHDDYANNDSPESERLGRLLDRIGISPPAYDRLLSRTDLLADQAIVRSWWWHYLTQEWPTNRAGLVIRRLENRETPPEEFLVLAHIWPQVTMADRAEMEQMLWRGYSAGQMSQAFSELYPQFSAEAFTAFQTLYQATPQALDY